MADKLSLDNVVVNQLLTQIKTGDIFKVDDIDRIAKKATIVDADGNEKVVSRATLERWYRELTEDEVQKWRESSSAEAAGENPDVGNEDVDGEAGEDADNSVQEASNEDGHSDPAGNLGESGEGRDGNAPAEVGGVHSDGNGVADAGSGNAEGRDIGNDGSTEGDDESLVNSPVTPSNAGKDKDKSKESKGDAESAKKNAALMKVRQTIIDTILADSPSIQLKRTTSYDVLKEKNNFAEITRGSNRFNVSVMSACLTEDQVNKVKINPASFGWSIDADFTVFDEGDIETAVQLIRQSREYRLAHPVTRKKKTAAAGKETK